MTMSDVDRLNAYVPQPGQSLSGPGIEIVIQAVKRRRENFPDEPLEMTLSLILMHIGARFDPLRCEGKEWRGFKKDIKPGLGPPTCPNGHAIIKDQGITLGWVLNQEDE